MCGILGFIENHCRNNSLQLEGTIRGMASDLRHRGPDDEGIWTDEENGLAIAHTRLSVIDLSREGHQPMFSACGRYVLVFNGEIYNFRQLRSELEELRHPFRGHSDTEVFLAAVTHWGLFKALERSAGMFAFALWDKKERALFLCRDRLGEKPLYYGWNNDTFFFASELKALRKHPDWQGKMNQAALCGYFKYNYVPAPFSIYQGIFKLPQGRVAVLGASARQDHSYPHLQTYWSLKECLPHDDVLSDETIALGELESVLERSVADQMISDVPLGAFLSGGIDSSMVVAMMQKLSKRPVKTFTIGFTENSYNEAEQAKSVAEFLRTEHHELYVSPEQAQRVIPELPGMYDEPFADSSQIPTYLVSRLARQHVTVCLSGDGGDEVFGGYNRYFWGNSIWRRISPWPVFLRLPAAKVLASVPPASWDRMFDSIKHAFPGQFNQRTPGDKMHKLSGALSAKNPEDFYQKLASFWENPNYLLANPPSVCPDNASSDDLPAEIDFVSDMMYKDTIGYLPDDILVKLDRAAMAVSLETRVPYLDHRLVQFAWRLPLSLKIGADMGKLLLRKLLYKYVPKDLVERPKMGFALPIDNWLRGPLKPWAEGLLNKDRLEKEGILNSRPFLQKWQEHLSGKRNWQHQLWAVLMFEAWLEHWEK